MNTEMSYLYRDGANYKKRNFVVLEGEITEDQINEIMDCLNAGEYFIPRQIGLPEERFPDSPTEDDHCWFELSEDCFESTSMDPTVDITVSQLLERFQEAKDAWDDIQYAYGILTEEEFDAALEQIKSLFVKEAKK